MATKQAHKRLTKEYQAILANPTPYIIAHPTDSNILEWHYIVTGAPDTPYEGGQYWGTLMFTPDYPFAPPAIRMYTPNGRFQTSTRLCLSISDFHPKSFNPAWSVSTILVGLMSFMNSEEMTTGSIGGSLEERRWYSARSQWWNSTGGGSATTPITSIQNMPKGPGNIKAGDGGVRFRQEWPELDAENWRWITENKIDPKTGRCLPVPSDQKTDCSPKLATLRRRLGGVDGNRTSSGAKAARDGGRQLVTKNAIWGIAGVFLLFAILSRFFNDD